MGYLVVDAWIAQEGFPAPRKKRQVDCTESEFEGDRVVLVKPRSYMNLSGTALKDFLSVCGPLKELLDAPEGGTRGEGAGARLEDHLLVVHDDLDLPFGKLRFRGSGSSGGHRGVASIVQALGRRDFGRLRIGIGREEGVDPAEQVLRALSGKDLEALRSVAAQAARCLPVWIREGLRASAQRFNGPAGELRPAGID
ncbi:MAG: aminoacyl-tRNA hydrolase [Planctomycetota bacterium]